MTKKNLRSQGRVRSGVRNFDELLFGGLPHGSVSVLGGTPGAGKTTLAMQICFEQAREGKKVIYFQTLSEPVPKTIRNMSAFDFFDAGLIDKNIFFCDLGGIMRAKGLEKASASVIEQMKKVKPDIVVIDSFRVFEDLAGTDEELRKFTYEVAVHLMAWECTALLLGEYNPRELESNPLSSIVDGIILLTAQLVAGEHNRFLQVVKMRGTDHDRNQHSVAISDKGLEVYAPRVTLKRGRVPDGTIAGKIVRADIGIPGLNELLGEGIPYGSTMIISGEPGTGKTILLLEAIYRGAKDLGEKGIFFSFSETPERLIATARGLGWNLEREIKRGMVEIQFVAQDTILVESNLLMMQDRIAAFAPKRIAIDSVSIFLHKLDTSVAMREKLYQLTTLVQEGRALGLLSYDVPLGSGQTSRFGVEEALVDGVVLLTSKVEEARRSNFIEVLKLRNTNHDRNCHSMRVGKKGVEVGKKPKAKD